jgi:hypothetical protein
MTVHDHGIEVVVRQDPGYGHRHGDEERRAFALSAAGKKLA